MACLIKLGLPLWLTLLCVILVPQDASAAGLYVRPMRIDIAPQPGAILRRQLELRNGSGDVAPVELAVVDLTQDALGNWLPANPEEERIGAASGSAREWVALDGSTLEVAPGQSAIIDITITVPRSARGFHSAALLLRVSGAEAARSAARLSVHFLVPILISVQGPPARQHLEVESVTLTPLVLPEHAAEAGAAGAPTSTLDVTFRNAGQTLSRVGATYRLEYQRGEDWVHVSTGKVQDVVILPGGVLTRSVNLQRGLPQGAYRIHLVMLVDGRVSGRSEYEAEFEGQEGQTNITVDLPLILPGVVLLEARAGRTAFATVTIQNSGTQDVTLTTASGMPATLKGVALGDIVGDDFRADNWLEVRPTDLTLRPGQSRNFRITARVPDEAFRQPNLYADLVVQARYEDGQSAGETNVLVWVHNPQAEAVRKVFGRRLFVNEDDAGRYAVTSQFANVGNIHLDPKVTLAVTNPAGETVLSTPGETTAGILLPLEIADYSGVLDFSGLAAGRYTIQATLVDGETTAESAVPIEVTQVDGRPVVTVVQEEESAATPLGGGGAD